MKRFKLFSTLFLIGLLAYVIIGLYTNNPNPKTTIWLQKQGYLPFPAALVTEGGYEHDITPMGKNQDSVFAGDAVCLIAGESNSHQHIDPCPIRCAGGTYPESDCRIYPRTSVRPHPVGTPDLERHLPDAVRGLPDRLGSGAVPARQAAPASGRLESGLPRSQHRRHRGGSAAVALERTASESHPVQKRKRLNDLTICRLL